MLSNCYINHKSSCKLLRDRLFINKAAFKKKYTFLDIEDLNNQIYMIKFGLRQDFTFETFYKIYQSICPRNDIDDLFR